MRVDRPIQSRIMVCVANPPLARQLATSLTLVNIANCQMVSEVEVITRGDNWLIDPDHVVNSYKTFLPRLVIMDPYGVEYPFVEYDDSSPKGFDLVQWFDQNPAVKQIVFTSYSKDELPSMSLRSKFIPQGASMTDLFQTVVDMSC